MGTLLIALSLVLIAPEFAESSAYGLVLVIPFVVGFVAFPVWNYSGQGVTGQTVGKRVMGIWVLRVADGRPTGRFTAISRNLLVPMVAIVLTFGLAQVPIYLWPLWDPKRRSLMDIVFSTVVCHQSAGERERP